MAIDACILTDLPIQKYSDIEGGFQYEVVYNSQTFLLKFPNDTGLFPDYKKVLKSLLYRKEWPFDKDCFITKELVERFIRITNYPKNEDFEKRVLLYLEWIYHNGGNQNIEFSFDPKETWIVNAKDEDEFRRIFERLEFKNYIKIIDNNKFKISKEGVSKIEELISTRPKSIFSENSNLQKPRISIIGVEDDHILINRLSHYFSNKGFATTTYERLDNNNQANSSFIFNIRPTIKKERNETEVDYWIFVKSKNSDSNNAYGTLLTIAMEAQINFGWKKYSEMISIAAIDDSNFNSWPLYNHYNSHFFDVRINIQKDHLAERIFSDWILRKDKKWEKIDTFWRWFTELSKKLQSYVILLRPNDIEEYIHSETQLKEYLQELEEKKLIRFETLPGCGKDINEFKVTIISNEPQGNDTNENIIGSNDALHDLERMLKNFHKAAIKLRERRDKRSIIEVNDEYDVQDILHSYLQLNFEDVRREDFNMSNAGSNTKIDFILKNENIGIEVKMASDKLKDKELGEQLLIDIGKYKSHGNCKTLVIFIYDKADFISNKAALIRDLERQKTSEMDIIVIISPYS